MATKLTHAFHYTFTGGTHGQAFTVPCANHIIAAFLDSPATAPDGACAQATPPNFYTPDQLLSLPAKKQGGSATIQDHMLALRGQAIAVALALALLFSAVPVYAVTEIVRVFRTRVVGLPEGWQGRLIAAAPWVPVLTGLMLLVLSSPAWGARWPAISCWSAWCLPGLRSCNCTNQDGKIVISGEAAVIAPTECIERPRGTLPQVRVSLQHGDELVRVLQYVKPLGRMKMAVVHPCDEVSLSAALDARTAGLIEPVLIGPRARLKGVAQQSGLKLGELQIEDVPHSEAAAARAVELALKGEVEALTKGSLHTDELMAAVVRSALRTERRMSHCFIMQTPAYPRPFIITIKFALFDGDLRPLPMHRRFRLREAACASRWNRPTRNGSPLLTPCACLSAGAPSNRALV